MINNILLALLKCLILTIFFETSLAFILGVRNKKDILNIVLVNILTNPLLNTIVLYINISYGVFMRRIFLLILEILAVLVEGFIYKKYLNFKKINPFVFSLILNLFSYLTGVLINGF